MQLHHCAFQITIGYSALMQEFCEFLGAKLIWEGHDQGREIAMRFNNGFCIQFSEMNARPLFSTNKKETHIAFASPNPREERVRIDEWFKEKNVKTELGEWSSTELWIDCPAIFINFVIEVLDVD
jgi:hypothetical protein